MPQYKTEPPYKGQNGAWLSVALFYEMSRDLPQERRIMEPVFSFEERPGYVWCRKTFVELMDVTGYEWAMKYLNSWEHFERLLQSDWFFSEYQKWCDEVKANLKAAALKRISVISATSENEAQALAASRYLAEGGWERTRGRPSKNELKGEMKRLVEKVSHTDEDMQRIGLTIIQGGK